MRDPADNLIEKRDSEGNMLLSFDIGPGNLKRVRRLASGETHSFDYDNRGRITRAATETHKVDIGYDEHGRCSLDVRDGRGVRHERLRENILQSTILEKYRILYRTEETDQLTVIDPTGAQHEFRADDSNLVATMLSNGTSILNRFDSNGRCLSIVTSWKRNVGSKWERNYEYSTEGMLLREFDSFEGEHSYEYDPGHRLVAVATPKRHRESYHYDNAGNLLAKPGLEGVMLQAGNRLAGANGQTFEYDSRDHIGRRVGPNGAISYHYDSCDRLTGVVVGGRVWSASYDPFGRRIEKGFDDEAKTTYYWDDNRVCAEITPSGRVRIYVYADKLSLVPFMFVEYDNAEQSQSEGRRYFIHVNQIGIPKRIDNDEGEAVWRASIEPYGQAHINPQSRIDFDIRFPGHWDDPEIGLFYNRFRYYSPELGRYLQSDPLGVAGGYNLYAYPPAPLTQVDIFGLHDPKDEGEDGPSRTGQDEEIPPGMTKAEFDELKTEMQGLADSAWKKMKAANEAGERTVTLDDGTVLKTSDSGMGPCLSIVKDLETGEIFYGQNTGKEPADLSPPLQDRTNAVVAANQPTPEGMPPGWSRDKGIPGSHSEVQALNQGMKARPDSNPSDFALHNTRTKTNKNGNAGEPMPRCDNCKPITDGVIPLTD